MMNLLDPDIPLEYLIPTDLPYADSYEQGMPNWISDAKSSPGIQIWSLIPSYGIPTLRCTILEADQLTFQNSKSFKPMMIMKHIKNLNQNQQFQNRSRCFHTNHYDCRTPILIQIWRKRLVYINGEMKWLQRKKCFWNIFELKIYRTFIIISTKGPLNFDFSWAQYLKAFCGVFLEFCFEGA